MISSFLIKFIAKNVQHLKSIEDEEKCPSFASAIEALFNQVREMIESTEPSWRQVLRHFIAIFCQRKIIDSHFSICQIVQNNVSEQFEYSILFCFSSFV